MDWRKKLTSRKFWISIAAALLIILNEGLDLGISREVYWAIVTPLIGYVLGEAYVDGQAARTAK